MNVSPSFRKKIGCWLSERWRAELIIRMPRIASAIGWDWRDLHNRNETVEKDSVTGGRRCLWKDSSPLTVARFFPEFGGRFLKHCLRQWPVNFSPQPNAQSEIPEVSFVVGVRGTGRLPQFQTTILSLLGQKDCETEVVVVEQSFRKEFETIIPQGVRYLHTPATSADMPFNRSWCLNAGATIAKGRIVVLHDGDYVVPAHFARAVARIIQGDIQSARLPRYIFYFNQQDADTIQTELSFDSVRCMDKIVQNNPTPMALTKESYLGIGGHDEAFYGWGGEDNEFLDRARTLRHCEGAFLPVFHLWHEEAPNRSGDRNAVRLQQIMSEPADERIARLREREFGQLTPSVTWSPS